MVVKLDAKMKLAAAPFFSPLALRSLHTYLASPPGSMGKHNAFILAAATGGLSRTMFQRPYASGMQVGPSH
eukprot:1147826-Pelagomonas_calceolata.AAC.1